VRLNAQYLSGGCRKSRRLGPCYFHFPRLVVLWVNRHVQPPSERGHADVQRSRWAPGQGGVRPPVAYLSESADFLEHFGHIDSACHESIAGSFCAMIRRKSSLAAWAGSGLVNTPNDTSAYYLR
jgi:hypothetical protein